jgi:exopolysaccharide biosynthesis polyprenyl glycosylphosphotransferase
MTLANSIPPPGRSSIASDLGLATLSEQTRAQGHRWKRSYQFRVLVMDTIATVSAVVLASFGRFGLPHNANPHSGRGWSVVLLYSVGLIVIWLTALGVQQSRDLSLVGVGMEEYRRVAVATAWVFGIVAVVDLVFNAQIARGYLMIAFPVGLLALMLGRHVLRSSLGRRRARGCFMNHVLVVGKIESILSLCKSFDRSKQAGYKVIGACVPGHVGGSREVIVTPEGEVPVYGDEYSIEDALRLTNADAVAVAASEHLGHEQMRRLAWRLDPLGVDMIVMPAMTDIAGPRLKVRPIDNLPLFHIARPRYDCGYTRYGKRIFDVALALIALVILTPFLLMIALLIKVDDGGPVIFRQTRVGRLGKSFQILKFRTMRVGSDTAVAAQVIASPDVIFLPKAASDPRITRAGRVLRTTSLDELPQLFNVLRGSMSIVGPRPLAVGEGASVDQYIERRSLMKPGMTGLWQTSGRSNSSAEDRIRLDHYYVDNWSWMQDILIVCRTVRAVLSRSGAY